jgi:hypothetical protein
MTSPYLNNWSDEPEEEPVEHLGPRALNRAREHAHEIDRRLQAERDMYASGEYDPHADPLFDHQAHEASDYDERMDAYCRDSGFDPATNIRIPPRKP